MNDNYMQDFGSHLYALRSLETSLSNLTTTSYVIQSGFLPADKVVVPSIGASSHGGSMLSVHYLVRGSTCVACRPRYVLIDQLRVEATALGFKLIARAGLCTCVRRYTISITPSSAIMSGTSPLPAITKPAPSFKGTAVVNGEFKEISLEDYKGKYLVLFFYPLDFTFVCPTEIIAFSDNADKFQKLGCEVVGCSTDSHFSHLAWINTPRREGGLGEMNIPLLADKNLEISRAYGVLKEDGVAFRGLFIIDGEQNLRQITVNDLPVGRSVEETLRLVEAFQFTDKHGEVCPANWKPGGDTMKPSVGESKAYFEKANN